MPVTTASAAIHIAPVVIKTLLTHSKKKAQRIKNSQAQEDEIPQDDLFFDEAFNIVKTFIKLGTKNTIESLQAFTNTHVPAPYWAVICPVTIPLSSCNSAADVLIEWFGPEELKYVVGGERWWQVRGLSGIDAEWVAEKQDVSVTPVKDGNAKTDDIHANILRMESLDTVMLYVHGGGYFWGSINTHRYQILHYAQKFKGRAFAVNYRKAPQYPWPCALQDVIAAYLYLIRPPPGAPHNAIPHSKIVFAGDSAGGGLSLTTLTILRDLGLPMPAGAVLISPWVDLTHSFPSVMQNYETDIIPKHGFLAKPSTLWPLPTQPENGGRVVPTVSNPPPLPGKADTLKPTVRHMEREREADSEVYGPGKFVKSQQEMLEDSLSPSQLGSPSGISKTKVSSSDSILERRQLFEEDTERHRQSVDELKNWEPKAPKILMENPNAVPLELRSQIQMYATTEQLTHPLVSPILQGSLGNLPPLYIIAGDGEVLRDEIIYMAHKAAHPADYPTREGVLGSRRQKENVEKYKKPTNVFDGMCHVLTVFMFTKSAKYAYRSIAEFIKHVTKYDEEHLQRNPFPVLHRPPEPIPVAQDPEPNNVQINTGRVKKSLKNISRGNKLQKLEQENPPETVDARNQNSPTSDIKTYVENENVISREATEKNVDAVPSRPPKTTQTGATRDISGVLMIRERVDLHGRVRPLEPAEALPALQLDTSEIGLIKEAPALRWADGQNKWDHRYSKNAIRVLKQKAQNEERAARIIRHALQQGFVHVSHGQSGGNAHVFAKAEKPLKKKTSLGKIQTDRRWGPLDLENERPPASAIAARRDTPEALALLKKNIYFTAPVTHLTVPKLKASDAFRAAFDPDDDPNKAPPQSASEMQVKSHFIPVHGLRMWDNILRYLGRKSTAKAAKGLNATAEKVGLN